MILHGGMAHPRKVIRHAVRDLLVGVTAAGARVTATRVEPHRKGELPAISVYTLREPVEEASVTTAPRELTRDVKVEITGWVAHSDAVPVDDAMDDLAEQIEAAMDADRFVGDLAAESVLEGTEMQVLDEGGADPLVGVIKLTYSVTYRTSPADPADPDDLISVGTTHELVGGVADTVPAENLTTVQEAP